MSGECFFCGVIGGGGACVFCEVFCDYDGVYCYEVGVDVLFCNGLVLLNEACFLSLGVCLCIVWVSLSDL